MQDCKGNCGRRISDRRKKGYCVRCYRNKWGREKYLDNRKGGKK
jgi:hypothetical protein